MEEISKEKLALAHLNDPNLTQHQRHLAVINETTGGSLKDDLEFLMGIAKETVDEELKFKCASKSLDAKLKLLDQLSKAQDKPDVAINVNTGTVNNGSENTFSLEDISYD